MKCICNESDSGCEPETHNGGRNEKSWRLPFFVSIRPNSRERDGDEVFAFDVAEMVFDGVHA